MTQQLVSYTSLDNIAILTLNNPRKHNALSSDLILSLTSHLEEIKDDWTVHVVILRALGEVFSSGHDLRELLNGNEEEYANVFALCTKAMEAIRLLPQPVIAQVHGLATAAGCQLVATCDLAVASKEAMFATPGVNIGLFCTTPGVALARSVPIKKAMEMLLTGVPISAEEALMSGLINRVVPFQELEKETEALARQVSSASPYVIATGKRAFYRQIELDWNSAYELAQRVMLENLLAFDAKEGIAAFLAKRPPKRAGLP
ncbi:enoyl-CoA hydratase [Dehalococcoidia bacterium]|nr:enoyl-CoA hydratase [Dehalococcoidia bacterium]